MTAIKNYVLGFLFSESLEKVVLIKKNRPEFMKGLLNGVGGKIELDEEPLAAMQREFFEETGVIVYDWIENGTLTGDDFIIHCFYSVYANVYEVTTKTDEVVGIYNFLEMDGLNLVPNVSYLIPKAIQDYQISNGVAISNEI